MPLQIDPLWTSEEAAAATHGRVTRRWIALGVAIDSRAVRPGATVQALIGAYQPAADALRAVGGSVLSRFEQSRLEARVQTFVSLGAPEAMARNVGLLRPLVATADIGDLSRQANWPEPAMAALYHQVGAAFDFDRLRAGAGAVPSADHFDRLAVRRLIEDLMVEQMTLTRAVAASTTLSAGSGEAAAEAAVDAWIGPRLEIVEGLRASVDEIVASGTGWTFAKLTIANSVIREIAASAN
jgi:glutamate dehydrogenase